MGRLSIQFTFAVLLLTVAAPSAGQQATSEVRGRAADQNGGALAGVTVVLTNEDTGTVRETTTGADGSYLASQLLPGRYRILASLPGFQTLKQPGLVLRVGTTLTINLPLEVGQLEQTITVRTATPLIDLASTEVGGHIGTAELSQLPAMNRSSFATIALLPGIQLVQTNQMGNDTIAAGGQASQNTNISLDGGYNTDDTVGGTFGAQVRTPLESIQEFQVATSMYGAEDGRAGGAIVNAVTKQGTNTFSGVAFVYAASNRLTEKDFLAKQGNLPKAEAARRDWGFVFGGPVVRNRAHFFFSLERQVDNPNRTHVYSARPDLNFSIAEERTNWNTLVRFDHQLSRKHTWAIRWLREAAPQHPIVGPRVTPEASYDETDLDQIAIGSLTSVFGNTRVNTFRVARTWEHNWQANECFRDQGKNGDWTGFEFGKEDAGNQALCPPRLDHQSFAAQAAIAAQGPWDSNYQIEDNFSWFVPNKKGVHNFKLGARFNYTKLRRVSQNNRNGTFKFPYDDPFDPAKPRTYPERLTIRTQGAYEATLTDRTFELYAQDKWQMDERTTVSLGVRYDLESIPIDERDNPLFRPGQRHPIDRNNLAPRVGFTRLLSASGNSLVRAGYGIFYNRTLLAAIEDAVAFPKFTTSIVAQFPNDAIDTGPRNGQFPSNPLLLNGIRVDHELLNQLYPPGALLRNTGTVVFDSPDRRQPFAHQFTVGYVRELASSVAAHADYVHIANKKLFLSRNLNPMERADTTSSGAITRVDAFGVLGETYSQQVWVFENNGESIYDALNLQLEKRYAAGWSARVSYSLAYSRGTATTQNERNTDQFLTDLRLDQRWAPTAVDRRHILSISGRTEIPGTGGATLAAVLRYMTGAPFTLFDSNIDADRNGELDDPLPAGTYSGTGPNAMTDVKYKGGRNGAYGPDYFQVDLRAGWRRHVARRTLELFVDVYNITNRTNFENPGGDRRGPATFLVLTQLRGGGGYPRQAQFGVRYAF